MMAVGLAIQVILFIPPFIAGLCGAAPRFALTYTAILTACLALLYSVSFIDAFRYGCVPLTDIVVMDLVTFPIQSLFELVMSLIAYYCGRALRALTLTPVHHFRHRRRPHRAAPPSPVDPAVTLVDILKPQASSHNVGILNFSACPRNGGML